jgi:hypothetical protein
MAMDKSKMDFIVKRGVLGVGLPVGILMSITVGFQVPGYLFKIQSFDFKIFFLSLLFFVPVFMFAGYFWGVLVYKYSRKKDNIL